MLNTRLTAKNHIKSVYNVKNLNQLLSSHNLLIIKERTSFNKIFAKINKYPKRDFVYVEKPKVSQMAAVLLLRLLGKKFFWIQRFENPPTPNFLCQLLLNQSDEILISYPKEASKLKNFGIDKPRIRVLH